MPRILPLLAAALLAFSSCARQPDKVVLAREVIKAIDAGKMLGEMMPQLEQMNAQIVQQMAVQNSLTVVEAAQLAKVSAKTTAISQEAVQGLTSAMENVYVEVYSAEELQAMKAFYLSPEGRSMLAKQPALKQKLSPKIQDAVLATQPRIQQLIQQEVTRILAERNQKAG